MLHSRFKIGQDFYTANGKQWRCTDKGSRTIIAIEVNTQDPSWNQGPPYAVVEQVFDESDLEGCFNDPLEATEN